MATITLPAQLGLLDTRSHVGGRVCHCGRLSTGAITEIELAVEEAWRIFASMPILTAVAKWKCAVGGMRHSISH